MSVAHAARVTKVGTVCAVVDDFLPPDLFEAVFAFCNAGDYRMVHTDKVQKVWRLHDGLPLRGPTYRYRTAAGAESHPGTYPTGSVIDRFMEAMLGTMDQVADIVGEPVRGWQEFTLAPWVYPVGAGLSLHQDTGRTGDQSYTGSYVFYAHPEWSLHWGGWLLLFDERRAGADRQTASTRGRVVPPWLSDAADAGLVRQTTLGTAVLPAPNRIVFINARTPHLITRVDQNAGDHPRVSLAGFLVRSAPDGA